MDAERGYPPEVAKAYEIDQAYRVYIQATAGMWERAREDTSTNPLAAYDALVAPHWRRYMEVAKAIRAR